jgi:hypothetical protein
VNDCDCLSTSDRLTLRGMSKPIHVFAYDANPANDPPLFHISRHDAQIRVDKCFVRYLSATAVQLKPPPGWSPDRTQSVCGGLFSEAWKPQWSGHFIVWQMTVAT